MNSIGISTDCVCDLPDEYLKFHNVEVVYFYITTATGHFKDVYEITSANILEYLANGGEKVKTNAPAPEEYKNYFLSRLRKYDKLIHISISSKLSNSYHNAKIALNLMGDNAERIRVIDSGHLSTGMGHMVIKAVKMRDAGYTFDEIALGAKCIKNHISTSFITMNADFLYRNGRVGNGVKKICDKFSLHPVLYIKDGDLAIKTIEIGDYNKSVERYIKGELQNNKMIDKKRVFITQSGCSVKLVNEAKKQVEQFCCFDEIIVTNASATISSNCGEGTLGIIFLKKTED